MSVAHHHARRAAALSLPLRELFFDDNDLGFWTYTNQVQADSPWWSTINGQFPGEGNRRNTIHAATFVRPGEVVEVSSRPFYSSGTVDEGLVLWGANENGGPLEVYDNGQLICTLSDASGYPSLLSYDLLDLRAQNRDYGFRPYGTNPTIPLIGMSRGWHVVTLRKIPNSPAGDTSSGGKALYFDGGTVYTRHPTFQ